MTYTARFVNPVTPPEFLPDSAKANYVRFVQRSDRPTVYVPAVPGNPDYDAIVADGVEIGEFVAPPPPVPESVPMWAAEIIAENHQAGLWAQLVAKVEATGNPVAIKAFSGSPSLSRHSDTMAAVAADPDIALDDATLDALFIAADQLAASV